MLSDCIVESCNGAQEVEGRATHATMAWTLARFDSERIPVLIPPSSNIQGFQEPEKGESL